MQESYLSWGFYYCNKKLHNAVYYCSFIRRSFIGYEEKKMSHNVYKVAIQMARTVPSLKEETGVTGYHILYGYSLLFQMDEKTLNLLFSEEGPGRK